MSMVASQTHRIAFAHGLGDAVMLTSLLRQLRAHDPDCRIEIACAPYRAALFGGLADEITPTASFFGFPDHRRLSWPLCEVSYHDSPSTNAELSLREVYGLSPRPDCWGYHVNVDPAKRELARDYFAGMPRRHAKLAIVHYKGITGKEKKDVDDYTAAAIIKHLEARGYDVLIWDANERSPLPEAGIGQRIEEAPPLFDSQPGDCGMLAALLAEADLVVGVDSGLLHLAAAVHTRAIGLWVRHHPLHFFCPDRAVTHLVPKCTWLHGERWLVKKPIDAGVAFYEANYDWRYYSELPATVAEVLEGIEPAGSGCRYLGAEHREQDRRMRHWLGKMNGVRHGWGDLGPISVDRREGFDVLLRHLRGISDPVIVETGTTRAADDFAGAGSATSVFGLFCQCHGGELHSVDLDRQACEFALSWCREFGRRVFIHHGDALEMLAEFERPIDVAYLDSWDADLPGADEHGLQEAKAAAPLVKPGGLIAFDDTPRVRGVLRGKGALAVHWLERQGWRRLHDGYQKILRKPE